MSLQAVAWALEQSAGSPQGKLILLLLADMADMDGYCRLDVARLASVAEMTQAGVRSILEGLDALEIVSLDSDGVRLPVPTAKIVRPPLAKRIDRLIARDGARCRYCGTREGPFECDHVIPVSRGGPNRLDNLVVACAPCNRAKGARTPSEWKGRADAN